MKNETESPPKKNTKSQLVEAAYRVIGRKGFSNFTIRDIASEAGLSTGLVHYYFKNKEELFLHLFKEMQREIGAKLNQELDRTIDPVNRLRIYVDEAFLMIRRENYFQLLINFWSQINVDDRMRDLSQRLFQSFREKIIEILEDGIADGCFREVDTSEIAATIVALIQGSIIQYMIDPEVFDYDEFARKQKMRITRMVI